MKLYRFPNVGCNCGSCGIPIPRRSGDHLCPDCRDFVTIADATAAIVAANKRIKGRGTDVAAMARRLADRIRRR